MAELPEQNSAAKSVCDKSKVRIMRLAASSRAFPVRWGDLKKETLPGFLRDSDFMVVLPSSIPPLIFIVAMCGYFRRFSYWSLSKWHA